MVLAQFGYVTGRTPGAAMLRIEAVRRVFPRCGFNEKTTEAGREALARSYKSLAKANETLANRP
jgi:hypothetical protein